MPDLPDFPPQDQPIPLSAETPEAPLREAVIMGEDGSPVNLIDPKLIERALKRVKALVRGNGVKADDVKVEECLAGVYPFQARTTIRLTTQYGIRIEPGMNKKAELAVNAEDFNRELSLTTFKAKTEPLKRQKIIDFLFQRPDKGFGVKDQKVKFQELTRDLVMHEGCVTCSKKGRVRCQKCSGDGMLTCNMCQGRCQIVCPQCRGTSHVAHGGKHVTCDRCRGDGKIACTRCVGRGQLKCPTCAAKGETNCEKCAGSGWLSHLAHIDLEAQIHFDFDRHVLPLEVTKMLDAFAPRLVEKGDLEVILRPGPVTTEQIEQSGEPPDTIFIDYNAKVPHGPIHFRIRDRIIPALMFGYHGKLIEAPSFLDDLTRKGQQVLTEAAGGGKDPVDKIRRAAKYRMLCDVIVQAAGKASQKAALEILTARYPSGISRERLLSLLIEADLALKAVTRRARFAGLMGGLLLVAAINAGYFLYGGREILGTYTPNTVLIYGLDGLLIGFGAWISVLSGQVSALFAQKKVLKGLTPPELKLTRLFPKAGKTIWVGLGGAFALTGGMMIAAVLTGAPGAPAWLSSLMD